MVIFLINGSDLKRLFMNEQKIDQKNTNHVLITIIENGIEEIWRWTIFDIKISVVKQKKTKTN